jgi:hypothetical protein
MRQSGANEVMPWRKAQSFHLLHGLLRAPALLSHAISRDHHSGAIVPQAAVDEYLPGWILAKKQKEACEYLVFGSGAVPGHRLISHPQFGDQVALMPARTAQVYDDADPHFCQRLKSSFGWLSAAIEVRRDLDELRHPRKHQLLIGVTGDRRCRKGDNDHARPKLTFARQHRALRYHFRSGRQNFKQRLRAFRKGQGYGCFDPRDPRSSGFSGLCLRLLH